MEVNKPSLASLYVFSGKSSTLGVNHNVSTSFCSSQPILPSPFGKEHCVTTLKRRLRRRLLFLGNCCPRSNDCLIPNFFFSGVCDLYCRIGFSLKPLGRVKDGTICYGSQKNPCIQGICRVSEKTTCNFALRRRHKGV